MNLDLLIFLFTTLFVILIGWYRYQKNKQLETDMLSRIKKPDIDQIAELLEKTKEPEPQTWMEKKQYELEQSGTGWTVQKYILYSLMGFALAYLVGNFFFHSFIYATLVGILGLFYPNSQMKSKRKKNIELFEQGLRNALQRMSSVLRAGGSVKQAVMDITKAQNMSPIIRLEFKRVYTDMEYGMTIEEAFYRMYERTGSEDVKMLSIVTEIQRQKGGNLAEILDSIHVTITDRDNQRKKMKTLTASQNSQANLLTGIPFAIYFLFMFISPHYFDPFKESAVGRIVFVVAIGMIFTGRAIMKKMVNNIK